MLDIRDSHLWRSDLNRRNASFSTRRGHSFRLAAAGAVLGVAMLLTGCEYGYSRSVLQRGEPGPAAIPHGSVSVGYQTGWVLPWSFGFSYADPSSPYWYSPYPYYAYDPWWSYPPRYASPWYPYPSHVVPYVVPAAPKRTFRFAPEPAAPPSISPAPPNKSKRRFHLP